MTGTDDVLDYMHFAARAARVVEENGITPTVSRDFHKLKEIHRQARPDETLSPTFDPDTSDIGVNDGFWMQGVSGNGDIVQLQAMRLYELGKQTLVDHLTERAEEYAPFGKGVDVKRSSFDCAPVMSKITGRVVYHGEFWLSKEARGRGFTGVFPRFLLFLAQQCWNPDWVFGLQAKTNAYRGLGQKEGYVHTDMQGVRWALNDSGWYDEALVWMHREDMAGLLRFEPADIWDDLEGLRRPFPEPEISLVT